MIVIYNVDVPMARLPVANWSLIVVTCVISMAVWMAGPPGAEDLSREDLDGAAVSRSTDTPPPLSLRRDHFSAGQLVTYVLVHADLGHLLGNMFFLFVFGNAVNAKLGHVPFLACYFLLGMLSGIPWLLFGLGDVLVGASGAIMGITGMFLVFFPRNDVCIFYFFFVQTGVVRIMSYWVVLLAMASDLVGTINGGGAVAYISHLGGELMGIVLAGGLILLGFFQPEIYEENLLQLLGFQEPSGRFDALGKPVAREQGRTAPKFQGKRGSPPRK